MRKNEVQHMKYGRGYIITVDINKKIVKVKFKDVDSAMKFGLYDFNKHFIHNNKKINKFFHDKKMKETSKQLEERKKELEFIKGIDG